MKMGWRLLWLIVGASVSGLEFVDAYRTNKLSFLLAGLGFALMSLGWFLQPIVVNEALFRAPRGARMKAAFKEMQQATWGPTWLRFALMLSGAFCLWAGMAALFMRNA